MFSVLFVNGLLFVCFQVQQTHIRRKTIPRNIPQNTQTVKTKTTLAKKMMSSAKLVCIGVFGNTHFTLKSPEIMI